MKITEVSVGWSETVSLPEYCNVRPSFGFTAIVEDGENPEAVRTLLLVKAKTAIRMEVDAALEANDQPPKYWTGPRFQILKSQERKAVVIMSDDTNDWPDGFIHYWGTSRGMRYEVAKRKAEQHVSKFGYQIFDCTDGDFDKLPPMPVKESVTVPVGYVLAEEEELPF